MITFLCNGLFLVYPASRAVTFVDNSFTAIDAAIVKGKAVYS